jgi:hypothetical protein
MTVNRPRSAAADSYLEAVGFYELLQQHGAAIVGTQRAAHALRPLIGIRELKARPEAERQIAGCIGAIRAFGTGAEDATRIEDALRAALLGTIVPNGVTHFVAERYADEAGWDRIEVGVSTLDYALDPSEWGELDEALLAWRTRRKSVGNGPMTQLVGQTLARGPGSFDLRSGERLVSASTRAGSSGRRTSPVAGTRLGFILNVTQAANRP